MTVEEYQEAADAYEGYCENCDEITRSSCEPDAREYPCPACGENAVFGIEEAMMMGLIEIDECVCSQCEGFREKWGNQ